MTDHHELPKYADHSSIQSAIDYFQSASERAAEDSYERDMADGLQMFAVAFRDLMPPVERMNPPGLLPRGVKSTNDRDMQF